MRVGMLGSGLMGGTLGTLFARAGHEVVVSYTRSEQKLKTLAREAQGIARRDGPFVRNLSRFPAPTTPVIWRRTRASPRVALARAAIADRS